MVIESVVDELSLTSCVLERRKKTDQFDSHSFCKRLNCLFVISARRDLLVAPGKPVPTALERGVLRISFGGERYVRQDWNDLILVADIFEIDQDLFELTPCGNCGLLLV